MNKAKYYISTYRARSLIRKYQVVKNEKREGETGEDTYDIRYEIDFTTPHIRNYYLEVTHLSEDTAMYYQFRKLMNIKDDEATPDDLLKEIIVVDFHNNSNTSLFDGLEPADPLMLRKQYKDEKLLKSWSKAINDDYRLKKLFDNGIYIKYEDRVVHYVPFDKSNSMARDNRITFVNERFLAPLTKRLNLDIDFEHIEVTLSKYYAYRGLYLTTADRFDIYRRELKSYFNEDTVIIVPDSEFTPRKTDVRMYTAKREAEGSNSWERFLKDVGDETYTAFDGEGIISPELSSEINKECGYNNAMSFQIRMPFAKGMLHTVDFKKFIREEVFQDPHLDEYIIEDAFGVERNLLDAHIIMPVSMLKCYEWLKRMLYKDVKYTYEDDDGVEHLTPMPRCMEFYFEKFHLYNHCMYISNTDAYYGNRPMTQMNYQFFNTLDMSQEEVHSLMTQDKGQYYYIKHPIEFYEKNNAVKVIESDDAYDDEADEEEKENDNLSWLDALRNNPVLAHENKINAMLRAKSESLKRDIAFGRITVDGEMRYLSRDMLVFLIEIIELNDFDDRDARDRLDNIASMSIKDGYFYLPNNKIKLDGEKYYALFRNPHLSRNEQCVAKAYIEEGDSIHKKYFSHLTGVIMVGYASLIPQALGGADFDGDIVKIIDNDIVCNAVKRGILDKTRKGERKRKLPIISIPDASEGKNNKTVVPRTISYEVIKNTFASKVGQISNQSIRIANREYDPDTTEIDLAEMPFFCADCTILTGLEIDAAKSGEHPELSDLLRGAIPGTGKVNVLGDYIYFKDGMSRIFSRQEHFVYHNVKEGKSDFDYLFRSKADIGNDRAVPLYFQRENDSRRALNALPKCFFNSLDIKMDIPGETENNRYIYFDFLRETGWRKTVDSHIREKAGAVIKAYYDINKLVVRANKYWNRYATRNFDGYINTIFHMQYSDIEATDIFNNELDNLYDYIADNFESLLDVKEALAKISALKWGFVRKEKRAEVLAQILNRPLVDSESITAERVVELLCNAEAQGYNILFYILCELENEYVALCTDEEVYETIGERMIFEDSKLAIDKDYYDSTYEQLYNKLLKIRDLKRSDTLDCLYNMCISMLEELCSKLEDYDLLKLFWQLGSIDRRHEFFWSMVPIKCINEHKAKEVE